MAPKKTEASRKETCVGALILVLLAGIAFWLFLKQSRFDSSILSGAVQDAKDRETAVAPSITASSDLEKYAPSTMTPLGPTESFGPNDLSDKIDGKAELYLSAGFSSLICRRFAEVQNPDAWMEAFVYDMGSFQSAFAVFSAQRRSEARPLDIARIAYGTENAVFFVHGHEYVEIVAASTSRELTDEMLAFARGFIAARPAEAEQVSESFLFPDDGMREGSITLLASDAFGFDRLDNIFIASYTVADAPATAFLSLRASEREASELAAAYFEFLIANGGSDMGLAVDVPGSHIVKIFDYYEIIFSQGRAFAGAHEAESRESAERLSRLLHKKLEEAGK